MRILIGTGTLLTCVTLTACNSSGSVHGNAPESVGRVAPTHAIAPVSNPATAPSQVADACGLLTDAQVAAATGTTVRSHAPQVAQPGESACQWTLSSTNPRDVGDPNVTLTVQPDDDLGA